MINRTKKTLLPLIKQFIKPGTTVISDCWKSYDFLDKNGFDHLSVNHSITFKDPETGAHTNTIEGTWFHVKRSLPKHGTRKHLLASYFADFMWRKKYYGYETFINHLTDLFPVDDYDLENDERLNFENLTDELINDE